MESIPISMQLTRYILFVGIIILTADRTPGQGVANQSVRFSGPEVVTNSPSPSEPSGPTVGHPDFPGQHLPSMESPPDEPARDLRSTDVTIVPAANDVQPIQEETPESDDRRVPNNRRRPLLEWNIPARIGSALLPTSLFVLAMFSFGNAVVGIVLLFGWRQQQRELNGLRHRVEQCIVQPQARTAGDTDAMRQFIQQAIRAELDRGSGLAIGSPAPSPSPPPAVPSDDFQGSPSVANTARTIDPSVLVKAIHDAASDSLQTGQDFVDVVEFDGHQLQSHLSQPMALSDLQTSVRELETACRRSDDAVLRQGNLLLIRHLRSENGEPNYRIRIRKTTLEALNVAFPTQTL